jgi:hypothetical protein
VKHLPYTLIKTVPSSVDVALDLSIDFTATAFVETSNLAAFFQGLDLKTPDLVRASSALSMAVWAFTGKPLFERVFSQTGFTLAAVGSLLALSPVCAYTILIP